MERQHSRSLPFPADLGVELGAMFMLLAALVVVPIAEIAVMVKVAEWIGTGQMIALLLSISIVGAWIVKRQGTGTLRRIRTELNAGRIPGAHLVDGGLLLLAGFLLLAARLHHQRLRAPAAAPAGARLRARPPRSPVPPARRRVFGWRKAAGPVRSDESLFE